MRTAKKSEVRCDSAGVALVEYGRLVWQTSWEAIEKVTAYQTDNFTIDTQWLMIEAPGGPLRVSEDVPGYRDLADSLGRFLEVTPRWREMVARTAFDANETVVFGRHQTEESDK